MAAGLSFPAAIAALKDTTPLENLPVGTMVELRESVYLPAASSFVRFEEWIQEGVCAGTSIDACRDELVCELRYSSSDFERRIGKGRRFKTLQRPEGPKLGKNGSGSVLTLQSGLKLECVRHRKRAGQYLRNGKMRVSDVGLATDGAVVIVTRSAPPVREY